MFTRPWVTAGEAVGIPGALTLAGNPSAAEIAGEYRGRAVWTDGPCGTVKGDGWSHSVRLHRLALQRACGSQAWQDGRSFGLDEPAGTVIARHAAGSVNLVSLPAEVVEWLQDAALTVHTDPRLPARGRDDPSVSGSQLLTFRAPWQWRAAWQTFPHDWRWQGSQTAIDRQIGNAVPPLLAEAIGREIVRVAGL